MLAAVEVGQLFEVAWVSLVASVAVTRGVLARRALQRTLGRGAADRRRRHRGRLRRARGAWRWSPSSPWSPTASTSCWPRPSRGAYSIVRSTFAGAPAAIENGGRSVVTTELAPITQRSPTVTPLVIDDVGAAPDVVADARRALGGESLPRDGPVGVVEAVVAVGHEAAVGEHAVGADLHQLDRGDLHAEVQERPLADADPPGVAAGEPDAGLEQDVLADLQPPVDAASRARSRARATWRTRAGGRARRCSRARFQGSALPGTSATSGTRASGPPVDPRSSGGPLARHGGQYPVQRHISVHPPSAPRLAGRRNRARRGLRRAWLGYDWPRSSEPGRSTTCASSDQLH